LRGTNAMPFEHVIIPREQQQPELRDICEGIVHESKRRYLRPVQVAAPKLEYAAYVGILGVCSSSFVATCFTAISTALSNASDSHNFIAIIKFLATVLSFHVFTKVTDTPMSYIENAHSRIIYANKYSKLLEAYERHVLEDPDLPQSSKSGWRGRINSFFLKPEIITDRLSDPIEALINKNVMPFSNATEVLSKYDYLKINDRGDLIAYKHPLSRYSRKLPFYEVPLRLLQFHQPFQRNSCQLHPITKRDKGKKPHTTTNWTNSQLVPKS